MKDWREKDMAISMGVLCEKCGTLHLINSATKNRVDRLPRTDSNIFALRCVACLVVRSFSREDLRAYLVSDHHYARGFAKRGEYQLQLVRVKSTAASCA